MGGIGVSEMLIIGLIILLLFGAKRLPGIARSFETSKKGIETGWFLPGSYSLLKRYCRRKIIVIHL
jgi:TatA/E family protein of Tat protein translocase